MANKVYVAAETALTWTDSGGDKTLTLASLAADGVRVGAQHDFGSGSRSRLYEWRFVARFSTAPVVGETVDVYLATSDGTYVDGNVGTSDAAGSTVALPNLRPPLGCATVQTTSTTDDLVISGHVEISAQYISPVIHNNTADALSGGRFILTPVPDEIQ